MIMRWVGSAIHSLKVGVSHVSIALMHARKSLTKIEYLNFVNWILVSNVGEEHIFYHGNDQKLPKVSQINVPVVTSNTLFSSMLSHMPLSIVQPLLWRNPTPMKRSY